MLRRLEQAYFGGLSSRSGSMKKSWGYRSVGGSAISLLPVLLLAGCGASQTTAERFAEQLNATNQYPACSARGCVESISAKDNIIIARYTVPMAASDFPPGKLQDRAAMTAELKRAALGDFCGGLQDDFPDMRMQWAGHYTTSDGVPIASILMTVGECTKFQGRESGVRHD
jgi:hypothetical protein